MKSISIVIPMYNEEAVALNGYERVSSVMKTMDGYDYEIIVVNDGSTDGTMNILKEIAQKDGKVKVISFSRNFGHSPAIFCGLKYTTGDAVVIIDADMQDPPEVIPDMIKIWEQGYQIVYGKRKSRKGETVFKKVTAKAFYRIIDGLSDVKLPKDTGEFRLIDRKVCDCILGFDESNKYLRGLFAWTGFKQYAFEYDREKRIAGNTKYSLKSMIKLAQDGIISFSTKPLKIVGNLGVLSIIISIIIAIYSLVSFFTGRAITPGWTSIMVTITFFSGIQLLSLWLIAEYIARIYDNSKNRPEYIVDQKINIE